MAASDADVLTFLKPRRDAFRTEEPNASAGVRRGMAALVAIGIVILVETFVYLQAVVQSPILPGAWGSYAPGFLVDIEYSTIALAMIGASLYLRPNRSGALAVLQPGGVAGFTLTWALFAMGSTVAMLAFLNFTGQESTILPLSDVARLQAILSLAVMTSSAETLLFQTAIPMLFRSPVVALVVSSVAFGAFHVWVRTVPSLGMPGLSGLPLLFSLAQTMVFGAAFFVVRIFWGVGACAATHAGVDTTLAGVVTVSASSHVVSAMAFAF